MYNVQERVHYIGVPRLTCVQKSVTHEILIASSFVAVFLSRSRVRVARRIYLHEIDKESEEG